MFLHRDASGIFCARKNILNFFVAGESSHVIPGASGASEPGIQERQRLLVRPLDSGLAHFVRAPE